jgi:tRNA threonylcarbamoyl adenosine modification protein (Sua5/YciO/YrdC/YwlC family)
MPEVNLGSAEQELGRAAEALRRGLVVAVPTDTVYGLAVDPNVPGSTERLFRLKGRPAETAVAVLAADISQVQGLVSGGSLTEPVAKLAETYWPGPLTLVVERDPHLGWDLGGDSSTIGVRVPDSDQILWLCGEVGPLAVTSANAHRQPPATSVAQIRSMFPVGIELFVDGGTCDGDPSTVVDTRTSPPSCIRQGSVAWAEMLALLQG